MKRLWSFFFPLLFPLSLSALCTIRGTAPDYAGKQVRLFAYEDLVTYTPAFVAVATVTEAGTFQLEADVPKTTLGHLRIGDAQAMLYLVPGDSLAVHFPPHQAARSRLITQTYPVQLAFQADGPSHLNTQVTDLNQRFDQYLADHRVALVKRKSVPKIDSFLYRLNRDFADPANAFLYDYTQYTVASMQLLTSPNRKVVYEQYLADQPMHYRNEAYMAFFQEFFGQYFQSLASTANDSVVKRIIAQDADSKALLALLGDQPYLQRADHRELVLLQELYACYYRPGYHRENIMLMLQGIAEQSELPEHRVLAENMVDKLTAFAPGQPAPDFQLRSLNGELVSLEQLRGRYVYLGFWASWCTSCLQELEAIEHLQQKYKDDIYFVSISVDESPEEAQRALATQRYKWHLLHVANDRKVKEAYDLRALPSYFIIDPQGNLLHAPAEAPSETVDALFRKLTGKEPYKEQMWDWQRQY